MNAFETKLAQFRQKQVELLDIKRKATEEAAKIAKEGNDKLDALKKEYEDKVAAIEQPVKNEFEKYRAELKSWVGFTDGEQSNVLQIVEAIAKIHGEMKA